MNQSTDYYLSKLNILKEYMELVIERKDHVRKVWGIFDDTGFLFRPFNQQKYLTLPTFEQFYKNKTH
jgi:hypothetical protein